MKIDQGQLRDVDLQLEEGEQLPDHVKKQVTSVYGAYSANGEWVAAKPRERNELSEPKWETIAFRAPRAQEAYKQLNEQFRPQFPGQVHLNAKTGLPGYLYCDFDNSPWQGKDPYEHAVSLMDKFSVVLSGRESGEVSVLQTADVIWESAFRNTRHLRYSQPVWGGHIVFTFDSKMNLVLITNSLFPVSRKELLELDAGDPSMSLMTAILSGKADGMQGVPENIGFSGLIAQPIDPPRRLYFPFHVRAGKISRDQLWEHSPSGWRNPVFAKDSGPHDFQGEYRPAWRIGFVDEYGKEWLGFVDVEKYGLLYWTPSHRDAYKNYAIFSGAQVAKNFEDTLRCGNPGEIAQYIADNQLGTEIWLGSGANTLRAASRVHLDGARLKDKNDPAGSVTASEREMYLGANVLYHAKNAQLEFVGLLGEARIASTLSDSTNPIKSLNVVLSDEDDSPHYDLMTRQIRIPEEKSSDPPVREPGYDGEVIVHEITHAVMHAFFYPLFQTSGIEVEEVAARAFDEGLAFYAACDYFDNRQWAEYAYDQWQEWRNISSVDLNYDDVVARLTSPTEPEDPSGVAYGIGMWWARVLWEFRTQFPWFNPVLLRTLHSLSSIQPPTRSAGMPYYTQIQSAFRVLGTALRDHIILDTDDPPGAEDRWNLVFDILQAAGIEPL